MRKWKSGGLKGDANTVQNHWWRCGGIRITCNATPECERVRNGSKSPLLGYQVHVSNQADDDLTTTPEDFLFHPELFACPVLRSLNCKHMKDVSQYLLCSKGILSKTYNFAA